MPRPVDRVTKILPLGAVVNPNRNRYTGALDPQPETLSQDLQFMENPFVGSLAVAFVVDPFISHLEVLLL